MEDEDRRRAQRIEEVVFRLDGRFDGMEKLLAMQKDYIDKVSIKAGNAYERAEKSETAAASALATHNGSELAHTGAMMKMAAAQLVISSGLLGLWNKLTK